MMKTISSYRIYNKGKFYLYSSDGQEKGLLINNSPYRTIYELSDGTVVADLDPKESAIITEPAVISSLKKKKVILDSTRMTKAMDM